MLQAVIEALSARVHSGANGLSPGAFVVLAMSDAETIHLNRLRQRQDACRHRTKMRLS